MIRLEVFRRNRNLAQLLLGLNRWLYDNSLAYRRLQALQGLLDPGVRTLRKISKDEEPDLLRLVMKDRLRKASRKANRELGLIEEGRGF